MSIRARTVPWFAVFLMSSCGWGQAPANTTESAAPPPAAEAPVPVLTPAELPAGVTRVSFGLAVRTKNAAGGETCRIAEPIPDPPTFTGAPKEITYIIELDPAKVREISTLLLTPDGQGDVDGINCNAFAVVKGQFGQTQLGNTISRLDKGPMKPGLYRLRVTVNGKTAEVPFYVKT